MIPVILAGGSGTRFWPLSRREHPKQFLSVLGDDRTLIETTCDRLRPLSGDERPLRIVCRPDLVAPTKKLLSSASGVSFIEEPEARNTAPAIALATARVESRHGDEPVAFFPADHFIGDSQSFLDCMHFAAERARDGAIITLGIAPTRPETGYGYIECAELPANRLTKPQACRVERFVEKPDHQRALEYLNSGRFLWNAGIFAFRPSTLWAEFKRQRPAMWKSIDEMRRALADDEADDRLAAHFRKLESISIDYAIMEQARRVEVVPALFRWSDVGHWASLNEVVDTDESGNFVAADALLDEVSDSVVLSDDGTRLIAASGLQQMVIVDTEDALLVIPKKRAQRVRELVDELKRRNRDDLL